MRFVQIGNALCGRFAWAMEYDGGCGVARTELDVGNGRCTYDTDFETGRALGADEGHG